MTQPKAAAPARKRLGYVRVSSTDQGRKFSPAAQRDAITAMAERDGKRIDEWFEDPRNGDDGLNRTNFQRICKMVAEAVVAEVYVLCMDRFARNTEDALRTARQFVERGTKLSFVETPADFETPEGRFQFTQYAAFAAFEHCWNRRAFQKGPRTQDVHGATGFVGAAARLRAQGQPAGYHRRCPDRAANL